ncbi:MAG: hypothetical protein AB4042_02060 [Leptolyngbyaceae cyanobacterium]
MTFIHLQNNQKEGVFLFGGLIDSNGLVIILKGVDRRIYFLHITPTSSGSGMFLKKRVCHSADLVGAIQMGLNAIAYSSPPAHRQVKMYRVFGLKLGAIAYR